MRSMAWTPTFPSDHPAELEVDTHRHQRNCFVLAQVFRHHQEAPHLAERVAHGAVERRLREDLASFFDIKLRKIIGVAEVTVHDPFVRRFEQRIVEELQAVCRPVGRVCAG